MKNITLSADETLLEAARQRAVSERTTLNEQFRQWLQVYARHERRTETAMETIADLKERLNTEGRRFSRDEMNER